MKISHLHIDQFRHLEDLKFDFTYPDDFHDESKRGKPLDKICIIGQSATGKTGILELIMDNLIILHNSVVFDDKYVFHFDNDDIKKIKKIVFIDNENIIKIDKVNIYKNKNIYLLDNKLVNYKHSKEELFNDFKNNIIYLRTNIISEKNLKIFNLHPNDIYEKYNKEINEKEKVSLFYDFDEDIYINEIIFFLRDYILFQKKFTQIMSELINKGLIADRDKFESEYKKWEKDNPKTLKDLAEKLNPLIHKLGLEIDMVNTEFPIPFRNIKTDEIISIDKLSTGTKGLLLSILPIYKLNTKNSIILIDEPERSLYPDIQMEIMEHYQNLAPEAQFIVATHSPFIAASFEPEERFILYFDENGKVAVRRGTSPIGDDPNDMLYNDFGIDYINKYGKKAHNEYLEKKRKLLFEENPIEKEKLLDEIESIGDKYNF
jgi:ABC-type cobalamin/Fe3+-siderophores transport system ATPase subunit